MLNALFTTIISSVCLISSFSVGVNNYMRQDVKSTNNVLDTNLDNYSITVPSSPYSSFLYPSYNVVGNFALNSYTSLDIVYSTNKDSAFSGGGANITIGSLNYDIMLSYTDGITPYILFLNCKWNLTNNSIYNFYNNKVLINSSLFTNLIYNNFSIDWVYTFSRADIPYNTVYSCLESRLSYRGVNYTYNGITYFVFNAYDSPRLVYSSGYSLESIYNSSSSFIFNSHITVRYGFDSGYSDGYTDGYRVGYDEGYSTGETVGYNNGLRDGGAHNYRNIFFAIADTPVLMIRSLFNFDFFGMNFFIIIVSMLTFLFLLFIVKKVVK